MPPTLTLAQRRCWLVRLEPEAVLMQGARHRPNRPDLYPGQRIVCDMDDAGFHLDHLAAPVAEAMPWVAAVIAGDSRPVAA